MQLAEMPESGSLFRKQDAQLRYYMHYRQEDIDAMSDYEWCLAVKDLEWIRQEEAKTNKG